MTFGRVLPSLGNELAHLGEHRVMDRSISIDDDADFWRRLLHQKGPVAIPRRAIHLSCDGNSEILFGLLARSEARIRYAVEPPDVSMIAELGV